LHTGQIRQTVPSAAASHALHTLHALRRRLSGGPQPQELFWFARSKDFDRAQKYQLFDCIECGCCSYVCPSHIPLVQYYRYAKSEISAREKEQQAADHARDRHETRLARIEREKQERAEKLAQKAAVKPAADGAIDDPAAAAKKAAIQAAIERAKAAKAESDTAASAE
jgi:Predicted NADH:ubiquinone oxidoreductase, subunit RnfC